MADIFSKIAKLRKTRKGWKESSGRHLLFFKDARLIVGKKSNGYFCQVFCGGGYEFGTAPDLQQAKNLAITKYNNWKNGI